jgi:hypothetical protein
MNKKLSSTSLPMSWLNKARISPASSNVKRFSLAVIAMARLTFANIAAESGVLLRIILTTLSVGILCCPRVGLRSVPAHESGGSDVQSVAITRKG